jgi:hypothetical protein
VAALPRARGKLVGGGQHSGRALRLELGLRRLRKMEKARGYEIPQGCKDLCKEFVNLQCFCFNLKRFVIVGN